MLFKFEYNTTGFHTAVKISLLVIYLIIMSYDHIMLFSLDDHTMLLILDDHIMLLILDDHTMLLILDDHTMLLILDFRFYQLHIGAN